MSVVGKHLFPLYNFPTHPFVRGEGVYLYDETGRRFLDFTSGIGVNALGHAHPALVEALTAQAKKLWHVSNLFSHGGQEQVAEMLTDHCFAEQVFFCNSGTEAVEMAIKMVRRYHHQLGDKERTRILCMEGAFHGRSIAAISAAGYASGMMEGFAPSLAGFDHIHFGDKQAALRGVSEQTAAILMEPIQGEGGIHVASDETMQWMRSLADECGALLVLDEVQCGMGRSGRLFYHQWSDITPDVVVTAKGLGGGFPIGACLATKKVAAAMTKGSHGSTFGGNPLAMAVAQKILSIITDEKFLAEVEIKGAFFKKRLEDLASKHAKILGEVRGAGLMLGIEIRRDRDAFLLALRERDLLTVGARGGVIRFLPPLIAEKSHIEECIATMEAVCATF